MCAELTMITNAVVDLSMWNSGVDFKLAKEDGILGVIHKASEGINYVDPTYAERRLAAEAEGLLWAAYHFGIGENGEDQANHFLEVVSDTSNVLLALDIEENPKGENITPQQADKFAATVFGVTGRWPLVYGNVSFLDAFATPTLTNCPLWVAAWEAEPTLPTGWNSWFIWQYTDGNTGEEPRSVTGIGPCDRDKFNGNTEELKTFWLSKSCIKNVIPDEVTKL